MLNHIPRCNDVESSFRIGCLQFVHACIYVQLAARHCLLSGKRVWFDSGCFQAIFTPDSAQSSNAAAEIEEGPSFERTEHGSRLSESVPKNFFGRIFVR